MTGPPGQHVLRTYARQGGKAGAQHAEIKKLLQAGWAEVTDEPEYAPRTEGVRLFKGPTAPAGEESP